MPNTVKVVVKLRPRSDKEMIANLKEQWTIVGNSIRCSTKSYNFDYLFSTSSTNADVFVGVIEPMVESCKNGFDTTIFTYGEKASGKTYTVNGTDEDPGIKCRAVENLFKGNQSGTNRRQFIIRVGYVEIYNEMVYDLLNRRQTVHFDHDSKNMSNTEVIVKDRTTLLKLIQKGNNAQTPKTGNEPSISHTIFQIIIESQNVENGQFQVGHLNVVDLDRSEGAKVKDERGNCVDRSMESFHQAIAALGKDEIFRQHSKSKLTRLLKTTFSGKANVAIICNINPTALKQTVNTLNFAETAQKAKIWPKRNQSDNVIMKKVGDELTKIVSHPSSGSTNITSKLTELESIVLMGDDMQPKRHGAFKRKAMEVLKIRPFPVDISSGGKKILIGEMDGECIDTQSRTHRKSMAFKWSDYYLERVGFEINHSMRRKLKYGKNLVGRSDVSDDIDICIDSLMCSRKQCTITVAVDETVSLTDHSSNGTTVNGVINKGRTVNVREGDVIAIVSEANKPFSFLIGNLLCTVYRLRKFSTETMQTYDVNDDSVVIVLSDDDTSHDGTSYSPFNIEVDLTPPSALVEVKTSAEESMVAESVAESQSVGDIATISSDLIPDGIADFQSSDFQSSDFQSSDFQSCINVNDSAPFEDLGDIIGAHIAEVETSNLGNLARELDMLANVQVENVRLTQQIAEERGMVHLKMTAMAEENSKLTAETKWLELKLAALTKEHNDLLAENAKLRAAIQNHQQGYNK